MTVAVNRRTGEKATRMKVDYPAEEALESLAGRVRPLILRSETIHYDNVFNALEMVVGAERLNEEIDVEWWRTYWRQAVDGNLGPQAYSVTTDAGSVTDRKLMYAWLYGDVLHAAAPVIARICDRVVYTHMMITELIEKGLLTVDPAVLSDDVVVTVTSIDRPATVYSAEVGTPIPLTSPTRIRISGRASRTRCRCPKPTRTLRISSSRVW